jgi:hypothetical protein
MFHKFDNHSFESPNQTRLADLNAFKQYLTFVEIRAIHQQ